MSSTEPIDAIVLAGGRASRMGGVDKPGMSVGGRTMLDTALSAVAGCRRIVVVGPDRPDLPHTIVQTQEEPAGAGPVAAIGAGLAALNDPAPLVVILAADMPFLDGTAIRKLRTLLADSPLSDAAFAVDEEGRPQYLLGVWRTAPLTDRLAGVGSLENRAMKHLVPDDVATIELHGIADCDTVADVTRAIDLTLSDRTLELDEARVLLRDSPTRLTPRRSAIVDAIGATLAEPLVAAAPLPRFDVSAMDGYAVAGPGPWRLRPDVGYAGGELPEQLSDGEAVRIATGAQVPAGATSVVRDEFATAQLDRLDRMPNTPVRNDIRRVGEDWSAGHVLADEGAAITPAVASAALSGEVTDVLVRGPVRAHVVVTGDEIRRSGPLRDGQTRDSLGPILPNLLAWNGIDTVSEAHLRDTATGFDEVFTAGDATTADLIVVVGATGGGAADQLRSALTRCGARILVHRVACRPGGSQVVAELADHRIVLGLPGNPFAATATLLVTAPAIVDGLTGRRGHRQRRGALVDAASVTAATARIVPVRSTSDGSWTAAHGVRTAHLAGIVGCDAVAVVPPSARDGDLVELVELPDR